VIAIGTAATSTLTTTTILIGTIGTTTIGQDKGGTGQARAIDLRKCRLTENGATIHRIAATHRTVIAEAEINLVKVVVEKVGADKPEADRARRNCPPAAAAGNRAAVHLQNRAVVVARHQQNRVAVEAKHRQNPAAAHRDRPAEKEAETRWVIIPHRGAITVEIAAAVMAAAAEIMRARVVAAAAEAWAAEVTAAAAEVAVDIAAVAAAEAWVAEAVVVVVDVGAVEDVVAKQFDEEQTNENKNKSYDFLEIFRERDGTC
jgi:hypothetical protein